MTGDNFISPAVKSATNVTTVLSGLSQGTHYSDVKRFNATTQTWESFAGSQFTQFEPGVGYNIIGLTNASFSYGKTETTTTFVYDSTGARVKKTAGGETAIYLGKDYEVDNVTIKHIFLGDRRITTKKSSGEISFIHDDHISSSNVVTDASGNQSAMYEYDPYGATVTHTGAVDLKHQFTGQEKDDSTGLHYYDARYYDSQLGRFITADWIVQDPGDPQSLNRYSYARNNPIKYTDPTGNLFWLAVIAIAAVVGAAVNVAVQASMGNIKSLSDLGKAAAVGAVSGALLAGGGLALGPVLGALGVGGSILATTAGQMAVTAGAAYVSNGVQNSFEGRGFNEGGLEAAAMATVTFGAVKIGGPIVQKGIQQINNAVIKPAISAIKGQLSNNPFTNSIGRQLRNAYNYIDERISNEFGHARIDFSDDAGKNLGNNPFKGKTPEKINEMFLKKGFEIKGPNPIEGKGTYLNKNTGRSYHIDANHPQPKGPHVGVQRPREHRNLPTRDYEL